MPSSTAGLGKGQWEAAGWAAWGRVFLPRGQGRGEGRLRYPERLGRRRVGKGREGAFKWQWCETELDEQAEAVTVVGPRAPETGVGLRLEL